MSESGHGLPNKTRLLRVRCISGSRREPPSWIQVRTLSAAVMTSSNRLGAFFGETDKALALIECAKK